MPVGCDMIRAGLVVLVCLGLGLGWQSWRLSAVRGELRAQAAALEGYREADRFRVRQQAADRAAAQLDRVLAEGVGANAGLSDYLRDSAGRVWP